MSLIYRSLWNHYSVFGHVICKRLGDYIIMIKKCKWIMLLHFIWYFDFYSIVDPVYLFIKSLSQGMPLCLVPLVTGTDNRSQNMRQKCWIIAWEAEIVGHRSLTLLLSHNHKEKHRYPMRIISAECIDSNIPICMNMNISYAKRSR